MQPTKPAPSEVNDIWQGDPEPDVWWGSNGIDALLWADPPPYAEPVPEATSAVPQRADDA
jgi:hypothetical protein